MKKLLLFMLLLAATAVSAQEWTLTPHPSKDLPACSFGLSRILVLAKVKPTPKLDTFSLGVAVLAVYIAPDTRWACPYERAIALYGDDRTVYADGKVSVCDEDGKTNCAVVYDESLTGKK